MKRILLVFLFSLIASRALEEKIRIVSENKDSKTKEDKAVDSFKSKNEDISSLSESDSKVKNGAYPCFFAPCEICKDETQYKKCANKCWAGMMLDDSCIELCELLFC